MFTTQMAISEIISKAFQPFFWLFKKLGILLRKLWSNILSITLVVLLIIFGNDVKIISHQILDGIAKSSYVQTAIQKFEKWKNGDAKEKHK